MSLPSIQIDRNFATVFVGDMTLWFSYSTLIAFQVGAEQFVRENGWGSTTGKHLNQIDQGDKANRMKKADFEKKYKELSAGVAVSGRLLG